jgi:hypothetical protein
VPRATYNTVRIMEHEIESDNEIADEVNIEDHEHKRKKVS